MWTPLKAFWVVVSLRTIFRRYETALNMDRALLIISLVSTVALAFVGIEMANNPPTSRRAKWTYRLIFIAVGSVLIFVTYLQGIRNDNEQKAITDNALAEQRNLDARYNQVKAELDAVSRLVSHPPSGLSSRDVAAVVHAIAGQRAETTIQVEQPYGNLADRCYQLGNAIVQTAEYRRKSRPDPQTQREEYNQWYRENDGLYFHALYYEQVKKVQAELAALHIDDPQLDELIKEHEWRFASRQMDVSGAMKYPEMYHLSIDQIQEIGEQFVSIASQIRSMR